MKVAIITENPFSMGGAERAIINLANMLSEHNNVFLIYTEDGKKPDESYFAIDSKIQVLRPKEIIGLGKGNLIKKLGRYINKKFLGINNLLFLEWLYITNQELRKFSEYVNDNNFDIVITPQAKKTVYLGAIKDSVNCICIGWQHSSYSAYFETKHRYYWNQQQLIKKYFKKLDACVVLTDADERAYKDKLEVDTKRIYNSLSILQIKKKKNDVPIVLWVGRMENYVKRLDLLFEIALNVLKKVECEFWIVGDGPDKGEFTKFVEQKHLTNNIKLFGATNSIEKYYSNANILVSTSRWEGFGFTLIEAMSYGIPIVSFKNSGPEEIVGESDAGVLIEKYNLQEFENSLVHLLSNESIRTEKGQAALQRSHDFAYIKIQKEWECLINELKLLNNFNEV